MTADVDRGVETEMETEMDAVRRELTVERTRADQLAAALVSNRRIGVAVGLVMVQQGCSESESFAALCRASMDTNRRVAEVAEDVISLRRLAPPPRSARRR